MSRLTSLPLNQILLATLWGCAVIRLLWNHPSFQFSSGVVLAVYVLVVSRQIRRRMQILIFCLALSAAILAAVFDGWYALWQGMEHSVIFAAFFGTVVLLRATADQRPEISKARKLVKDLGAQERNSGLMAGSQFLGSVLNVGVMSIFAPIIGRDNSEDIRKAAAEACQRGMCLCCLWSPFWLAMALCYEHLPNVTLWQIMTLGLCFVLVGFIIAHLLYTRDVGFAGSLRAVTALLPVLPPVTIAASVVLLLNATTSLSTLQCLVTGIPLLCLIGLAFQGRPQLATAIRQSGKGIGTVHGEVVLLTAAILLGKTLILAIEQTGFDEMIAAFAAARLGRHHGHHWHHHHSRLCRRPPDRDRDIGACSLWVNRDRRVTTYHYGGHPDRLGVFFNDRLVCSVRRRCQQHVWRIAGRSRLRTEPALCCEPSGSCRLLV